MQRDEIRVLIVGAGPVGLIMGLLLHRLGVDFRIVERRPGLHQAPQAHVISSRTLEICQSVGIDHMAVRAAGPRPEDTASVRWVDRLVGRDLGVFEFDRDPRAIQRMLALTPTPTTNLSQDRFETMLFERLAEIAGSGKVLFEHEWEACTEQDGRVLSTVRAAGGSKQIESRYLIGADGAGSRVRKAAGIGMTGPDNLQTYINIHFSANLRERLAGRESLLYWVMDQEVEGVFIAHDIERNWIFMKTAGADEALDSIDEAKFTEFLREAIGQEAPLEIHGMNAWRMTAQIADGYRRGRLFLVGDAAHRFPPTGGIGMNTGFQDAHNLAWKIAMVEAGVDATLLETYETERRPVAQTNSGQSLANAMKMQEVAVLLDADGDRNISFADIDAVLADPERKAAVQRAVDAQAAHFNMIGLDLGVCYTGAAVIGDGPPPVPDDPVSNYLPSTTPGARLPHALLKRDGDTLSTLALVPHDSFLVMTRVDIEGKLQAAVAELRAKGAPVCFQRLAPDSDKTPADDGSAALFPENEALLVRPDGHIAARFANERAAAELAETLDLLLPGWRRMAQGFSRGLGGN